jgi:DNA-binding LytR/AlgR family response regulator
MNYKCIIVDDEPLAHTILKNHIAMSPQLELTQQCYSAEEARRFLSKKEIHIMFLDIEMPEETGISFLKSLTNKPITIFTTAFLHYTLEGFDLGVMDYLVKPIRPERFKLAVDRAIEFLNLQSLKSGIESDDLEKSELLIKTGTKRVLLTKSEITHVQALKDYMIIYSGNKKYVIRSTMSEMESLLGSSNFLRVHKSFIVAKQKLRNLSANGIEFDQFEIPVGGKYKPEVEKYIQFYK